MTQSKAKPNLHVFYFLYLYPIYEKNTPNYGTKTNAGKPQSNLTHAIIAHKSVKSANGAILARL